MIDPIDSLAFSIHSNKGIYALLLGSGISRAAGIPTGWEIVLDLIRKLAVLKGANCEPDPAAWYKETFGADPEYSKLLTAIAKSPSERNQLLKSYFEPTEEEKEQGLKVPTVAHKSIASLVEKGFLRVIVTTNFDRLIERALEEIGIVPPVISTPDSAEGVLPLTHNRCTVIKVNGDYLDLRIKNIPEELSKYDERMAKLLDRVFDEFGLVVCGWSAEWDVALKAAVERCQSRRFSTFWTIRSELSDIGKNLVKLRSASVIKIQDADTFFSQVAEKVGALEEISKPHPLSVKAAVISLKKYIAEDRYKIKLYDLVHYETEQLYQKIDSSFSSHTPDNDEELLKRMKHYESITEILLSIFINGCYWGERQHSEIWLKTLERIGNPPGNWGGVSVWLHLRMYPALILLYGGGITCLARERYETLSLLLTKPKVAFEHESYKNPPVCSLHPIQILDGNYAKKLPGLERDYTPLNNYLFNLLREPLKEFLPNDKIYETNFDKFEYLLALTYVDLCKYPGGYVWGPIGRFIWKNRISNQSENMLNVIEREVEAAGSSWPLLKFGLFGGSLDNFKTVKSAFDQFFAQVSYR